MFIEVDFFNKGFAIAKLLQFRYCKKVLGLPLVSINIRHLRRSGVNVR